MIETLLASKGGQQLLGNLGAGLGQGLGEAIGGGGGPMQSGSGVFDLRSTFDGSGWTVSTGSSKATAENRREVADSTAGLPGLQTASMSSNPLMLAVMLGLFVMFVKRGSL